MAVRTQEGQTDNNGCQAVQQPVGALTQILLHLPDKQPENGAADRRWSIQRS